MQIEKIISGKLDNNTYVVKNNKNECIIIDASANVEDIKDLVEDCSVKGVLLTHGHYDHFVNLDNIINAFDTKCYLSEFELEKLYSPKLNYSIVFNTFSVFLCPGRVIFLFLSQHIYLKPISFKELPLFTKVKAFCIQPKTLTVA